LNRQRHLRAGLDRARGTCDGHGVIRRRWWSAAASGCDQQPSSALLREAIAGFLNPCAIEQAHVDAVVVDLVTADDEICSGCSRVRPDAYPKVVGDYVIRDRDVRILVRDFDPASLTVGIVQVDLTIDDPVRVDQQGSVVQHVYLPAGTQATTDVKQRHVMIVLQGVATDRSVLGITYEDSIRLDILNQVVCYGDVSRTRGTGPIRPDSKECGILNYAVLNRDALCARKGYSTRLGVKDAHLLEQDAGGIPDGDGALAGSA